MYSKKEVCIVVPIHSDKPSKYELISFEQCFKVLGKHPIKIVAPQGLNLIEYKKVIKNFEIIYINPKWQSTLLKYNKLKLSVYFYSLFKEYEYLLTYELDAFVFSDQLLEWCKKGYDYIGAPWFENFENITVSKEMKMIGVGNSGFSLRRVSKIRKFLRSYYYPNPEEINTGRFNEIKSIFLYPYRKFRNLFFENYTVQRYYNWYEDYFISTIIAKETKNFLIAQPSNAMMFSFETNPAYLFKLNNNQLPFGCHAWWRYDLDFWKPFIELYGYTL